MGSRTPEQPTRHQGRLDPSPGAARPVTRGGSAGSALQVSSPGEAEEAEGAEPEGDCSHQPVAERLLQQLAERRVEPTGLVWIVPYAGHHDERADRAERHALGDVPDLSQQ